MMRRATTLKELVSRCEFDLTSTAKVTDGAVTDLDKDGLGEATFAWSAGCRSDVSPVTHKVLLITPSNSPHPSPAPQPPEGRLQTNPYSALYR